jgi:hypothetical protein
MRDAIRDGGTSDVPCGTCAACCTSSQFVHIGPDEADALAHVPAALLVPAPGLPPGHMVLGYDERGHCPLLVEGRCSIYAHRPRTCRTYDCRIFAASAGAVDSAPPAVARRARRWRFDVRSDEDRSRRDAVRAAAAFVAEHAADLPAGVAPASATQRAVLAVELHDVFLQHDPASGCVSLAAPEPRAVRDELVRRVRARAGGVAADLPAG